MKTLALAGALALALVGCSATKMTAFDAGLITTTQNVVALNNALVQVNNTLINNDIAQAKLLAPYQCGAYALAAAILNDSSAAAKVNAYLTTNIAANVSSVAVKDICAAVGYPTTVTAAPAASK
ncbi:MAG: hypothetical protein ABSF67_03835 [Roseiarcus sp.]|jgi:hypothetical protein